MNRTDNIRTVYFRPYRRGLGPTFILRLYYLGSPDNRIGFTLAERRADKTHILFEGEDFRCSPLLRQDSDECVKSIMNFLTLRPGDTDADYFDAYTNAQREYCDTHAEALSIEVYSRFGE